MSNDVPITQQNFHLTLLQFTSMISLKIPNFTEPHKKQFLYNNSQVNTFLNILQIQICSPLSLFLKPH